MKFLLALIHLPDFLKLAYFLLSDRRVPWYLKALVYGAVLYLVSPIDILPDYLLPGFGYIEDIFILYIVIKLLIKYSPSDVVREYVRIIDEQKRRRRWKV